MADETTPTEGEAIKTKGRGMIPLVGGVAAGVALGAVIGLLVLGPRFTARADTPRADTPRPATSASAPTQKAPEGASEKKSGETPLIYQVDNLVLNPAGSGGTRFLLVSVALAARDEAVVAELKARDAELRDMILRLLGSKTADQVADASTREALRTEMLAAISQMLPGGAVRTVYFPQFVIQ